MPAASESPNFIYATCREGSEPVLKADVARRHPGLLTPAFMRPQLITWKAKEALSADFALASPFARSSGFSLGAVKTAQDIATRLLEQKRQKVALCVTPRVVPEDGVLDWSREDALQTELKAVLSSAGITVLDSPADGQKLLEVILEPEDGKNLFAGLRTHHSTQDERVPRVTLPSQAPSRAWLKLEQALARRGWAAQDMRGLVALDLGCAPGGASLSLLDRGLRVTGVDTGDMDEAVLRHDSGGFRHLRMPLARLDAERLPPRVDLLLCDINLAPPEVLPHLQRLQDRLRAPRLILTLKMNAESHERRIDEYLTFIRSFAPAPVSVTQLAASRREVCVIAG